MTLVFRRAGNPVEWGEPYGLSGGPMTWRPVMPSDERPRVMADQIALATCAHGHECAISTRVHTVSADGVLHPSYVCPVPGCSFHEWVVFDGWTP